MYFTVLSSYRPENISSQGLHWTGKVLRWLLKVPLTAEGTSDCTFQLQNKSTASPASLVSSSILAAAREQSFGQLPMKAAVAANSIWS